MMSLPAASGISALVAVLTIAIVQAVRIGSSKPAGKGIRDSDSIGQGHQDEWQVYFHQKNNLQA